MSFRPVGPALTELLAGWLEDPERRRAVLARTWDRAVGEAVGRRCRPLGFEDGTLRVEVTDSAWARQLQTMSDELVAKVNAALGYDWVREIAWVSDACSSSRDDAGGDATGSA